MTHTVSANLKVHFALETTTIATCFRITLTNQQPTISNVTATGSPSIVTITTTYPHGYVAGDVVQVVDVVGTTGLNYDNDTNDIYYSILTVPTDATFTIADPGIGGSYTSGGEARKTYGITNTDKNLVIDGATYYATNGGVPVALRETTGMEVGTTEYDGVYTDAINVTEYEINTGKLDFAEVEVFVCNYESLTDGKMITAFGYMGQLELERNAYRAQFESLSSVLAQDTIRILSPDCPYDFGDSNCGIDVDGSPSFTFTGSATTVISRQEFTDSSRAEADGYFTGGLLTWTSGDNAGLQQEVQDYTSNTFTLFINMPYDIATSDTYQVVAGCDKTHATCKAFGNIVNFGGMNFLPGQAAILSVGGQRDT